MVELLTNPIVITLLLTIAGIGIVVALFSPRFGIPGFISLAALVLFFYGHFQAGLAGYGTIALFVIGMILIILEFFLPGAIAGTIGMALLLTSLILSGENGPQMGISLLIAIFLSLIVFFLMVKVFHKRVILFNRMILYDAARKEDGYVSNVNRSDLLGMEGITLTPLHPSGTAKFNDERIDVVSEGDFIPKNTKVKVIKAEGARIVVRKLSQE